KSRRPRGKTRPSPQVVIEICAAPRGVRKFIHKAFVRGRTRRGVAMAEEHVIQEKALRRFCEQVLAKLGVPAEDARVTTDVLVLADLRGIDSHGVARLGRYVSGLKQGTMQATDQSSVVREAQATAIVDGGQSLAPSTVPRGKVEVYNRLGQPMPHGWAVDETGRSSTDPARVLNALAKRLGGGLLPLGGEGEDLGGHKGYGLALMVDVLCGVLSGAATGLQVYADEKKPDVGHFFMALDPTAFRPLDEFRRDMDRLARELKESPKAHGQDRIYVHGEKSFARMEKFRTEGIPLDPKVDEGLKKS